MDFCALLVGKADIEAVLCLCNSLLVTCKALGNIQQALLLHKAAIHVPCVILTLEDKPANGIDIAVQILRPYHIAIHAKVTRFIQLQLLENIIVFREAGEPHPVRFLTVQGSDVLVGGKGVIRRFICHAVVSGQRCRSLRRIHAHDEGRENLVGVFGGILSTDVTLRIHCHRVVADEEGYRLLGVILPHTI